MQIYKLWLTQADGMWTLEAFREAKRVAKGEFGRKQIDDSRKKNPPGKIAPGPLLLNAFGV